MPIAKTSTLARPLAGGRGGGGGGPPGGMGGEMAVVSAMDAVAKQLDRLTLSARPTAYDPNAAVPYQRAVRPGVCTQGRVVNVLANHFKLDLRAKQAFHYDVASGARLLLRGIGGFGRARVWGRGLRCAWESGGQGCAQESGGGGLCWPVTSERCPAGGLLAGCAALTSGKPYQ